MLVDDQPLIRMGIELALKNYSDISIVAKLANGLEAVESYAQVRPDVVLMDIQMPEMDGLEASGRIRDKDRNAKIIFLTNNDSLDDILSAISLGASGYCLKDIDPRRLYESISIAFNGGLCVEPQIAASMLRFFISKDAITDSSISGGGVSQQPQSTKLNTRDSNVLTQLVTGSITGNMNVSTKLSVVNILNRIVSLTNDAIAISQADTIELEINDRFEFLELIGRGAMGIVYKSRLKSNGMIVAIKVFQPQNQVIWNRTLQEASIMSKLSHDGIVSVQDLLVDGHGAGYLIMEFVDGPSLDTVIECGGAIVEKEAVPIFVRCADALHYLHSSGIVHRDIKPSNIILFSDDESSIRVKITDFGISRETMRDDPRLTMQGEVFGSPLYMSPEQCLGKDLDALSDIYSFGCLMFEVICGTPPFVGANCLETMNMHVHEPLPVLQEFIGPRTKVSSKLVSIIKKCLDKDPSQRFRSAAELKGELAALIGTSS
jgi:Serine/threonine protein kinase